MRARLANWHAWYNLDTLTLGLRDLKSDGDGEANPCLQPSEQLVVELDLWGRQPLPEGMH